MLPKRSDRIDEQVDASDYMILLVLLWIALALGVPFFLFAFRVSIGMYDSCYLARYDNFDYACFSEYKSLQWWSILSSSIMFAIFGSSISFLSRTRLIPTANQKRIGAKNMKSDDTAESTSKAKRTQLVKGAAWIASVNRVIYPAISIAYSGAIFGMMIFLIFLGGFVEGALFPNFEGNWHSLSFQSGQWARLLVWSFVAGFSERLVPGFLDNLVARFEQVAGPDSTTRPAAGKTLDKDASRDVDDPNSDNGSSSATD